MTEVEEDVFDINSILKRTYVSLKELQEQHNIELIFEMDKHVPRDLRGNDVVLENFLVTLFSFILENSNQKDILLTVGAPEDFMYEENISFTIKDSNVPKEKVLAFLETGLGNNLNILNGNIVYSDTLDFHIAIPFTIGELGFRRHYRLPSKSMLGKKVFLIVESDNVIRSITTMFKYFPCDVDFGVNGLEEREKISDYDVLIIEENLANESLSYVVGKIQEKKDFKYVLLSDSNGVIEQSRAKISTYLLKPVIQESIFELIISLFEKDKFEEKKSVSNSNIRREKKVIFDTTVPVSTNLQSKPEDSGIHEMIEEKKLKYVSVLDTKIGLENSKKKGESYASELKHFLETFHKSDLYFRQIVNEKQTNKIKDFCIDLEKQSKVIGAESMQKFADIVSLIFVYNKLDMLPIYPGRYHLELTKLEEEIKKYLHIS